MIRKIKENIYNVGAIDWHRRLFDELIPLPHGTSYNAYLIKDEKIVLIDTVDPSKSYELLSNLEKIGVSRIDYIIAQHAEQDHSGSLPAIIKKYPMAKIVTNSKCKNMLLDLMPLKEENFIEIKDGEELSIGSRSLKFIFTPWVHWPETMLTYLKEDGILFTCDFFGSHMATSELYVNEDKLILQEAKRYYAEIMMPFANNIKKHLEKISHLEIKLIAPSHGPIYNKPHFIINAYKEWISDETKNLVIIAFVSMHGSVGKMVEHLTSELAKHSIDVLPFNLTKADIGEIAMALVDASTIIIASPTVLTAPHPSIVYATHLVNMLRPKTKFAAIIGSYGWGGMMEKIIKEMLTNFKGELLPSIIIKGEPKEKDFELLNELAEEVAKRHKKAGIA